MFKDGVTKSPLCHIGEKKKKEKLNKAPIERPALSTVASLCALQVKPFM